MMFSPTIRHLLVTLAVFTGSAIELARGYRPAIVIAGFLGFTFFGNLALYLAGSKERALRNKRKRDYFAAILLVAFLPAAHAQLLPEPAIPAKVKKQKRQPADLEWMFQYSPPPDGGREHELIQDPDYRPFLERYFTTPQSFWGPNPTDPKSPLHKSLADTIDDHLTIPGQVLVDENRYIVITGAVRRLRTQRGLVFADLGLPKSKASTADPLVLFAAIDWIRDGRAPSEPEAEYTLWLFPSQPLTALPSAVTRALTRWMAEPIAGTGIIQRITHAILVAPDGTPTQVPVPAAAAPAPTDDSPSLTKRK